MGEEMMRGKCLVSAMAGLFLATGYSLVQATPYASSITVVGGTTVNYTMNEDSDSLKYSINGGGLVDVTDGLLKGPHSFTIPAGATFSIVADRTELGFTQSDGGTLARAGAGVPYDTASGNGTLTSSLSNLLTKFNSPRGVSVSNDPNATNFGTVYVANSNAGATGGRTLTGRGLYALKADQTDAGFQPGGDVNAAAQSALFGTASTNSPYKVTVGQGGVVYTAGFGDALSGVWSMPPNLSSNTQLLAGTTGPTALPAGQNHGSVAASYVTGSAATNNLVLYTLDEDLSTSQVTGSGSTTDTNKLWRYDINGNTLPYSAMPTKVFDGLIPGFSIVLDIDRGADGKWYHSENRGNPANSTGVVVTDAAGATLWDSRLATAALRPGTPGTLSGDRYASTPAGDFNHDGTMNAADYVMWRKQSGTSGPDADANGDTVVDAADYGVWRSGNGNTNFPEAGFGDIVNDLYANIFALAVSPDQKWLATLHNNDTVMVTPLVNGIPDVANRLAVPLLTQTISARDIAYDAAGNLHVVSSGLGQYLVIAPGGHTVATTSWNGSSYAFNVATIAGAGSLGGGSVPEPGTLALVLMGVFAVGFGRRRQ
jgi:hypothetical protein